MKNDLSVKTISRNAFLRKLALGAPLVPAALATAQPEQPSAAPQPKLDPGNLRAFVELARSDIRTQKALIVAENIAFTNDEAVEFWPLHRDYETDLNKLLDRRYELILRYAEEYRSMTDSEAVKLANDVFDLEEKRTSLKRKYFKMFRRVVAPVKAARFFQLENQLNMVLDLQIAASLPLIQ